MDINIIKQQLLKQALIFDVGGFRPQYVIEEPWIGAVHYYHKDEELPTDSDGMPMVPLLQLPLFALPLVPEPLKRTQMLTVFCSRNYMPGDKDFASRFCIRQYTDTTELVRKELIHPDSYIKPFPLSFQVVEDDRPSWDSADMPHALQMEILKLEDDETLDFDYFEDVGNAYQSTKLGGYAAYIQGSQGFPDGYEFLLQIASDFKANFNIVDSGNFYFAFNKATGKWLVDCDFY